MEGGGGWGVSLQAPGKGKGWGVVSRRATSGAACQAAAQGAGRPRRAGRAGQRQHAARRRPARRAGPLGRQGGGGGWSRISSREPSNTEGGNHRISRQPSNKGVGWSWNQQGAVRMGLAASDRRPLNAGVYCRQQPQSPTPWSQAQPPGAPLAAHVHCRQQPQSGRPMEPGTAARSTTRCSCALQAAAAERQPHGARPTLKEHHSLLMCLAGSSHRAAAPWSQAQPPGAPLAAHVHCRQQQRSPAPWSQANPQGAPLAAHVPCRQQPQSGRPTEPGTAARSTTRCSCALQAAAAERAPPSPPPPPPSTFILLASGAAAAAAG